MSWLVSVVLDFIFNKLLGYFKKTAQDEAFKKETEKQVNDDVTELKNAKTEEEKKKAVDDIAKDSF